MSYSAKDNYCEQARKYQSVPSEEEAKSKLEAKGISPTEHEIAKYRKDTKYPSDDFYQMGTIQDDYIYISTTDGQHQQIMNGEPPNAQGGISGYFTDQATIDHCTKNGVLDNGQLNRELQIAPFQSKDNPVPSYKPHTDCFTIDRDRMQEIYGTRDFNAAIAKCEANNQFGEGGGNQGYNPYISEMIQNGVLKHDPGGSYSDQSISKLPPDMQNSGTISNSTVEQIHYDKMIIDAQKRTNDCIQNNTPHPSRQVVESTGYAPNSDPVPGRTGNAIPIMTDDSLVIQNNRQKPDQMPTRGLSTQSNDSEKGASSGMPNTSYGNSAKPGASSGMPTTNIRCGQDTERESSSVGMPNHALGWSKPTEESSDLSQATGLTM